MARVRLRPTDIDLIKILTDFNKSYFTVADLEKILDLKRESLLVTLTRLVKAGLLVRLKRNMYTVFTQTKSIEKIGSEIYYPSYLSFESALARYGILSQLPYTVTFATLRHSKKVLMGETQIAYSHLKKELFWGYRLENGIALATPEKALLDQLYLMSRGKRTINLEELDLREINRGKFNEYARRLPKYTSHLLREMKKYIGTTPITNERNERIRWRDHTAR